MLRPHNAETPPNPSVIPAQAGIQYGIHSSSDRFSEQGMSDIPIRKRQRIERLYWIPAYAGMTSGWDSVPNREAIAKSTHDNAGFKRN